MANFNALGPPVLIGERVHWTGSGSGIPQSATVRWIGVIPEITKGWTIGIELDKALPVGGIDGTWRKRQLFSCEPKCGLLVPLDKIEKHSKYFGPRRSLDAKMKNHHILLRQLSLPQSTSAKEFIQRVLLPPEKIPAQKSSSIDFIQSPTTAIDELEKFKENVKALERFKADLKPKRHRKSQQLRNNREEKKPQKIGKNPESLYEEAKARRGSESDLALFQKLVASSFEELTPKPKLGLPPLSPPSRHRRRKYFQCLQPVLNEYYPENEECQDFVGEAMPKYEFVTSYEHTDRYLAEGVVHNNVEVNVAPAEEIEQIPEAEPPIQSHDHGLTMTSIAGRFRRIDEDFYDKEITPHYSQTPPTSKRRIFNFLRWFKKPKTRPDIDITVFNASVTSSPVLPPRNRCESLFSLATVSSFAFVPASQYQHYRKKRKAPPPPVSLPNTLKQPVRVQHRRTVSECYKDRKSGAFRHVKNKRKAPPPPEASAPPRENIYPTLSSMRDKKKKRVAPQPPVISNDTLKLDRGVLMQNKIPEMPIPKSDPQIVPVSPRPWYKRKASEKKKEKEIDDWMPEIGFARPQVESGLFNFFTKITDKEEKRRSQVSILANISELDREAAEIVRKEHQQEKELLAESDEKFYEPEPNKPSSTKELISLFNSISNTPRVTLNLAVPTLPDVSEPQPKTQTKHNDNVWVCYKCTLENLKWKLTCDACGAAKPAKSEMDLAIDWEQELKKYFPERRETPVVPVVEEPLKQIKQDDMEEIRRRRVAFFMKSFGTETTSVRDAAAKRSLDDAEKLKLKGMLRELKNARPKHEIKNNDEGTSCSAGAVKKVKSVDREFELIAAKDLPTIMQNKSGIFNTHVYANMSDSQEEEEAQKLTTLQGIAAFKAGIDPSDRSTCTLAINRLLRKLELAIADGEHQQAASLARELAVMKINCCVTRQKPTGQIISLNMYVEDKVSHKGPIALQAYTNMTVADLKEKVDADFQFPAKVQRWILGKQLVNDDNVTLEDLGVTNNLPVFLYLVAPGPEEPSVVSMSIEQEPVTPVEIMKPTPPLGKGWYYNYEDDRYSYCESSGSEKSPEKEIFSNQSNEKVTRKPSTSSSSDGEAMILQPAAEAKPFDPLIHKKSRINSSPRSTPESSTSRKSSPTQRVRSRSIFDLIKPVQSETLKKDLKVISPNAVKETIEKLARRSEDTRLGWKCPQCTLINPNSRPGCAACTADRPLEYSVPPPRPADEELKKLRRDLMDIGVFREESPEKKDTYNELMNLDTADLVPNTENFDCPICLLPFLSGQGVVLRDCLHTFCRACLVQTVEFSEEAEVKCPFIDATYTCESVLQQREIKALVPRGVFEQHLAKSVAQAERRIGNAFHCKTPDCTGWCIYEDNVNEFACPVCKHINCLTCQAIHESKNCLTYQQELRSASGTNKEARRTKTMLEDMVQKGDAMACPTCQVVLMKKWGCDWLRCSMCKTEICWVTRGPRWGPGGKGDTSSGCQCGLNGVKCHPKCNYCH